MEDTKKKMFSKQNTTATHELTVTTVAYTALGWVCGRWSSGAERSEHMPSSLTESHRDSPLQGQAPNPSVNAQCKTHSIASSEVLFLTTLSQDTRFYLAELSCICCGLVPCFYEIIVCVCMCGSEFQCSSSSVNSLCSILMFAFNLFALITIPYLSICCLFKSFPSYIWGAITDKILKECSESFWYIIAMLCLPCSV